MQERAQGKSARLPPTPSLVQRAFTKQSSILPADGKQKTDDPYYCQLVLLSAQKAAAAETDCCSGCLQAAAVETGNCLKHSRAAETGNCWEHWRAAGTGNYWERSFVVVAGTENCWEH